MSSHAPAEGSRPRRPIPGSSTSSRWRFRVPLPAPPRLLPSTGRGIERVPIPMTPLDGGRPLCCGGRPPLFGAGTGLEAPLVPRRPRSRITSLVYRPIPFGSTSCERTRGCAGPPQAPASRRSPSFRQGDRHLLSAGRRRARSAPHATASPYRQIPASSSSCSMARRPMGGEGVRPVPYAHGTPLPRGRSPASKTYVALRTPVPRDRRDE